MKQRGVTLIQLLFGLALVALLTQLATASYSAMSNDLQRQAVAKQLAQALRATRNEALLRNEVVTLQARENGWGSGWRMVLDQGHEPLLREYSISGRIRIVGNHPVAKQVRFSGLGVPLREGNAFLAGSLQICSEPDEKKLYQIVLSRTGRVSLRHEQPVRRLCPD